MPVPKVKSGQSKAEYVSGCIRFLHHEQERRPPERKRSDAQIKAICISSWNRAKGLQRNVTLQATDLSFKQLGNALLVEGDLLRPGTFVGLDGVPTHYSKEFIRKTSSTIIGKPIHFAHAISDESMLREIPKGTTVGFWTSRKIGDTLKVLGYIFDPIAISYVKRHPRIGLSAELKVHAEYESQLGVEDAKYGKLTGGALIDDPACPACRISTVREVSLETKIKKMKGVLNVSAEDTET